MHIINPIDLINVRELYNRSIETFAAFISDRAYPMRFLLSFYDNDPATNQ